MSIISLLASLIEKMIFVELEMDRSRLAILSILDQKDHQESNNRRTGVDNELPVFRVTAKWSHNGPDDDGRRCEQESPATSSKLGRPAREATEKVATIRIECIQGWISAALAVAVVHGF